MDNNEQQQGGIMNERERSDFESWAARLEAESRGTEWGVTLYALWDIRNLMVRLIDAMAQDKSQGAGKLFELIGKGSRK